MTDRLTGDEDFPLVRELTYLSYSLGGAGTRERAGRRKAV